VYTAEQAKRGEGLYTQHCAACHGGTLLGAEAAPALTGFEFGANWSGLTLGDLFERLRTSMPADDPGKVSAQQKADIVAHMLKVGGFPAGMTELPRDQHVLTQIKYLATKP
jgi:mono/diheme cytochrome c family protein